MERLKSKMMQCDVCGKEVYARGLQSHMRLLHSLKIKSVDKKSDTGVNLEAVMKEFQKVEKILNNINELLSNVNIGQAKIQENYDIEHIKKRISKAKTKKTDESREEQLSLF
jgi:hypothetical protein